MVGPDEPFGSHSQADIETDHWAALAGTLQQQGVLIDLGELRRLGHHVEFTEPLRDVRWAGRAPAPVVEQGQARPS